MEVELLYKPRRNGEGPFFSVFPGSRVFTWANGCVAEIVHNGNISVPTAPEPIPFATIVNGILAQGCTMIVVSPDDEGLHAIFGVVLRDSMRPSGARISFAPSMDDRFLEDEVSAGTQLVEVDLLENLVPVSE